MPERYIRSSNSHPEDAPRNIGTMKTLFIAFLVATVCIGKGSSLRCYSCGFRNHARKCPRIIECKESDKYCVTEDITAGTQIGFIEGYTKRCSRNCPKSFEDERMRSVILKCCDTDECND